MLYKTILTLNIIIKFTASNCVKQSKKRSSITNKCIIQIISRTYFRFCSPGFVLVVDGMIGSWRLKQGRNGEWNTVVSHSGCLTQWLCHSVVMSHSGPITRWSYHAVVVLPSSRISGHITLWSYHSRQIKEWSYHTVLISQWSYHTVVVSQLPNQTGVISYSGCITVVISHSGHISRQIKQWSYHTVVLSHSGRLIQVYLLSRQCVDVNNLHGPEQNKAINNVEVFLAKEQQSFETLDRVETLNAGTSEHVGDLCTTWHVKTQIIYVLKN